MSETIHFKALCACCKQQVEFLSVIPGDQLCVACQLKEKKKTPSEFGWTLHPDCKALLNQQTSEKAAGAKASRDLRAIRRLKKSRAMKGG